MNQSNDLDTLLTGNSGGSLISKEVYFWTVHILHVPLLVLTALGTVTNFLNILVFLRQGVTSDSITVSLFAKSTSDFMSTIFLYPEILCWYLDNGQDVSVINFCTISVITMTYPHLICMKFTCLITTYISVERAIFVVLPLHVKRFIRVKRTVAINVILGALIVILYLPYTSNIELLWVDDSASNSTSRAVFKLTALGEVFYRMNYVFNSLFLTNATIVVIATSTVVLVTRLKSSRKWRKTVTGYRGAGGGEGRAAHILPAPTPKPDGRISSKNLEICKTVTAVTALYLACLIGSHLPALAVLSLPGMAQDGENRLLYGVIYTLRFDVDALSSSLNMFFYYKTSSKYKRTFIALFGYESDL